MKSKTKKLISLFAVFLFIFGVANIFSHYLPSHNISIVSKPVAMFGPKVDVGVETQPILNISNFSSNTSISLQVFSAVPGDYMFKNGQGRNYIGSDQSTNNSKFVTLLNVTLNETHSILFLSSEFNNIAKKWRTIQASESGISYPSLTVEAYKTVYSNDSLKIYQYYNNLQYNPMKAGTFKINASAAYSYHEMGYFNGTSVNSSLYSSVTISNCTFNLNLSFSEKPMQIIKNVAHPLMAQPSCSDEVQDYWEYQYVTSQNIIWTVNQYGAVPLLLVHMGSSTDNMLSNIAYYASILFTSGDISMESSQAYVSSQGNVSTTMSSYPSFAHIGNSTFSASGTSYVLYPYNTSFTGNKSKIAINQTTGYVGIQNATYTITHYDLNTTEYHNEYQRTTLFREIDGACEVYSSHTGEIAHDLVGSTYDGNGTTVKISWINSTASMKVSAGDLPIEVYQFLSTHAGLNKTGELPIYAQSSNGNASYSASDFWTHDTGYSSATSALNSLATIMTTFSTSLGVALTIIDVESAINGLTGDASEAAIVTQSLDLMATYTGFAAYMLSQFSSISFVSNSTNIAVSWELSNTPQAGTLGSNYYLSYYHSSDPVTLVVNGNDYTFDAPEDYVNVTSLR